MARRTRLLMQVVRVMYALAAIAFTTSLFEPQNRTLISVAFYGCAGIILFVVSQLARRGFVNFSAWLLSLFFWVLIAFVTLFFGGLQGQHAATFCVCVMLVGGLVGGRAAIVMALVTSAWCAFIAFLEEARLLPPQLGAYSPINAWTALTVTLVLTSALLRASLESLERAHADAEANARERDLALAKSIEAQKMEIVGNLSGGIAHDFNNLLTVIAGSTSLLRSRGSGINEVGKRYVEDIEAATSRATLMTRQLLSFAGARGNEHSAIDLTEVVRAMGTLLPRLLGSRITIHVKAEDPVVVLASRAGLEQILLNLSINARDAMPDGGELFIELRTERDFAVLTARDTGSGMTQETLARVFEPFFTTKSSGTGLGLATVQARVAQFRGTITADSELGQGATFTVRLPVHGGVVQRSVRASEEVTRTSFTGRALLVEDDGLVRRTLGRVLEDAGFDVTAVANGAEALAVLRDSAPFAVVVSDLSMPVMDGHALIKIIRERWPKVAYVLMSGNASVELSERAEEGLNVLAKPVEHEQLLRAIREAIARVKRESG